MDIFWEKQQGGLCRLHSINTFFGFHKYTPNDFSNICDEYDETNQLYNTKISCKSFDLIHSDQKNIISYIIHKNGIYTKYYPINYIQSNKISKDEFYNIHETKDLHIFFIYNETHIWIIKKHNNKWYNVDSLSGVSEFNCSDIYSYIRSKNNMGFIIPINHIKYFYNNLKVIKKEITNSKNIENYLIKKNLEKKILGDIEVPLNICIDILNYVLVKKNKLDQDNIFFPIKDVIETYYTFIKKFTNSNYNNINLILEYLPNIINKLFNINKI